MERLKKGSKSEAGKLLHPALGPYGSLEVPTFTSGHRQGMKSRDAYSRPGVQRKPNETVGL
jgi:hypothetical protein